MASKERPLDMPKQVDMEEISSNYGRFIVSPLERGFGLTIGNSLRRILLSSIGGAAITSLKIDGVLHEFSTIPNCLEDVTEIILNLKQVRLKVHSDSHKELHLKVKGKKEVKAGDLEHDADVEIVNPDIHIATLTDKGKLEAELGVDIGTGYVPAAQLKDKKLPLGTILMDALFSPVAKVKYRVEKTRVGERTDYDRLILQIWTDGTIHPTDALSQAAAMMRNHMALFIRPGEGLEKDERVREEKETKRIKTLLATRMDEIELSVRSRNCLEREEIKTLADLILRAGKDGKDMLKYKNFGKKSLDEIRRVLEGFGLHFGMDVGKYLPKAKRKAKENET